MFPFSVDGATDPDRQVTMVIDLNKCMGCQTCSVSCKTQWTDREGMEEMWWNKVNTMPGEGSPRGWEEMGGGFDASGRALGYWRLLGGSMEEGHLPSTEEFGEYVDVPHDDVVGSPAGEATTRPDADPEWMYNWDEDRGAGEHPNQYFFYLPRLCNHCTRPACLEACPRDAIYKREKDGIVLVDEDDCNGYRFCVEACPYKVIYFNPEQGTVALGEDEADALEAAEREAAPGEDVDDGVLVEADGGAVPHDGGSAGGRSEEQMGPAGGVPPEGAGGGIAQKCVGCFPRVERGVAPACVRQCPGRARFYGYREDPESAVHRLVDDWEVALPLHPEFNTEPNVYYVPPLSSPRLDDEGRYTDEDRIPLDYLEGLFGDGVEEALETLREERERVRAGEHSELMETLIGYRWPDDFFHGFTGNPADAKAPRDEGASAASDGGASDAPSARGDSEPGAVGPDGGEDDGPDDHPDDCDCGGDGR